MYAASPGIPSSASGEKFASAAAVRLIEKIPYLQQLGITAVELLPVFQFDPRTARRGKPTIGAMPRSRSLLPHQAYSSRQDPLGPVDEFRDMVKALHRARIEVILDVVFNHTTEGHGRGPTLSFRSMDNDAYYILRQDRSRYTDYTGNTLNANHPIVRRMIVDSLRYWVEEMHVDGFRFDLASILSRDQSGQVMANPPVCGISSRIRHLPAPKSLPRHGTRRFLQVGSFIGDSLERMERPIPRRRRSFFRGEEGSLARFADRMVGSPEIYGHKQREAEQSVNFVTCHDGFTLNDLVSYDHRGTENRKTIGMGPTTIEVGTAVVEGPTESGRGEAWNRQVKNFLAVTLLSIGLPMILMGERGVSTQRGNNNAYCHNNTTSTGLTGRCWLSMPMCIGFSDAPQRAPAHAGCGTRAPTYNSD